MPHDINIILADCPGLGRIRLCECNSVHLSLGPVTINLDPEAFAQAATLIRTAMVQLEEISGGKDSGLPAAIGPLPSRLTH